MRRGADRASRVASRALLAAACALGAHGIAYGSLVPADGRHAYLGWYDPVVAALSVGALLTFGVFAASAVTGRRSAPLRPISRRGAGTIVSTAMAWLAAQETIERSLSAGTLRAPELGATGWLVALLTVMALAGLITVVSRAGAALVKTALARRARPSRPPRVRYPKSQRQVRARPLARHAALRAPPATS